MKVRLLSCTLVCSAIVGYAGVSQAQRGEATPQFGSYGSAGSKFMLVSTRTQVPPGTEAPRPRAPRPGQVQVNPQDGAEMVWVPQGEFMMGADTADLDALWRRFDWPASWRAGAVDEAPGHVVELDGFWLYRHEVTVAQYRRFCAATGQQMPPAPLWGWVEEHPVVNVSWEEAAAYCRWASVRLPSEAEWERAARGEYTGRGGRSRRAFAFGDRLPDRRARVGNVPDETYGGTYPDRLRFSGYEDGFVHPAPVGSFRTTAFGLHDIAGNAQEWCADWYAPYAPDRQVNPGGPATGKYRVCRGGSWGDTPSQIRVSDRNRDVPTTRYDGLGFRPARTPD